jgi:predicted amidohydrolase
MVRPEEVPSAISSLPDLTVRVAVVQAVLAPGAIDRNLDHVAGLARAAAREHGPDIVVLPDAITGPTVGRSRMDALPTPDAGVALEHLGTLAGELGCLVAGGYLAIRGVHAHASYVLAEPDGSAHLHDRAALTPAESRACRSGWGDGFSSTSLGPIGLASGTDFVLAHPARMMRGWVRIVIGGACLDGSLPIDAGRLARVLGVPVALARQVGFASRGLTRGSQIIDREGHVLAEIAPGIGDGFTSAEVVLRNPTPAEAAPETGWLTNASASRRAIWQLRRLGARCEYAAKHRRRALAWQAMPAGDPLRPYTPPPGIPREQRPECRPVLPVEEWTNPVGVVEPAATAPGG